MSASLESLLELHEADLWHRYRGQAESGLRKQALDTLEEFVSAVERYPLDQSEAWAAEFCTLLLDERQDLPLQHPLLVRVLLPALRRGYERGRYP